MIRSILEAGLTKKGEIKTESLAALYGGITSTMDMPNVSPASITLDLLEERFQLAKEKSWTNYSFYLGASPDNIDEIKKANPRDICGLKIFMGSSTGDLLVNDDDALDLIFKESPILIVTHCEDNETIENNLEKYQLSVTVSYLQQIMHLSEMNWLVLHPLKKPQVWQKNTLQIYMSCILQLKEKFNSLKPNRLKIKRLQRRLVFNISFLLPMTMKNGEFSSNVILL